mmetsp:Transcript_16841/g.38364  ORF Transcript_16841/g.38364 Transcript_16841/m.38364 type:complete len:648 (-) Transcript_16841:93-2036(-)
MIGVFTASFSFFIASSMAFQPILIQFNSVRCSTQFSKSAKPGVYKMRSSSENIPLASRQGIDRRSSLKRWSGIKLSARRALFHGSVRSFESMKTTGQNLCALRNEKILWPAQKNPKNMLMYILKIFFRAGLVFLAMVAALAHHAMAHMVSAGASMHEATGVMPPLWKLCLLGGLIVTSACLAGAETAITTLWPWKVKKIAEEEGEKSPFKLLERDITKFLTAILIGTTTCTIYSAALAAEMAAQYGGDKMMTIVTIWLTVVTLVFGEIMPKALAVAQAERVARIMVPAINVIAMLVYPVGKLMQITSKVVLSLMGVTESEENNVSEEELRMIVMGAKISGEIRTEEQDMIESVLDLQDTLVTAIMKPRVEVVAVEASTSIRTFVKAVSESGYSRIPVYDDNIDNIIGMVLAKSLIDYLDKPGWVEGIKHSTVADIMDPAYYVPESMTVWNALEEMRLRRVHMAIVVDEYGGTAGIVTMEDILEEVIGEIYDEDDIEELVKEQSSIYKESDGSFTIEGSADLEETIKALQIEVGEKDLIEFATLSGYLCHKAGCIPAIGTEILLSKTMPKGNQKEESEPYMFEGWKVMVTAADERRVISVSAHPFSNLTNMLSSMPSVMEGEYSPDDLDSSSGEEEEARAVNKSKQVG